MVLKSNREYYIDEKGQTRRKRKPHLLALYNQKVYSAFGYCKLKQCYLTKNNISEKQCLIKGKDYCTHLYVLEGNEIRNGVKRAKQKKFIVNGREYNEQR